MPNSTNLPELKHDCIMIVDFGSQYTQLIARRLREQGFYCELVDPQQVNARLQALTLPPVRGIILSGGPDSVTHTQAAPIPESVWQQQVPVLGICYGMQAMAQQLGGTVSSAKACEFGYAELQIAAGQQLMPELQLHPEMAAALHSPTHEASSSNQHTNKLDVWMSHGDHVEKLPAGFQATACTTHIKIAAMADTQRHYYGLQFHPEVTHTEQGKHILQHFASNICHCQNKWTTAHILDAQIKLIKQQVGNAQVILGLSGGVDSSVSAALLQRAIGDQLTCVFVDTGLLRANEAKEVNQLFKRHIGMNVVSVDAQDVFIQALKDISDPEEKRKVVGRVFIDVFSKEAKQLAGCKFLAQGTIYPDVIESARSETGSAKVIKSHHNVGGLPENLPFSLIEPLRDLFKDEVRRLGEALALPQELLYRHPFPGPGLSVRILGEVKAEYIAPLQQADNIFIQKLRKHGLYDTVSQAFAVFLPVKAVGVKGDQRCYEHVIALRAVKTVDFMTAEWAPLPYDFLAEVSLEIMNQVPGIARVVYDISGKPPATIEWE